MRKLHFVKVYFDRRSPVATDEWLTKRVALFRATTLRSLKAQRVPFVLWLHCDPGMESLMEPLLADLDAIRTYEPYGCRPDVRDVDYVYVTRVDSDDLLAPDALECVDRVQCAPDRVEAAIFRRGYLHDGRETAVYYNPSSPFHTLMFPRAIWDARYREEFVGDHSKVGATYPVHVLPDWKFCVQVHDANFVSTMEYSRVEGYVPAQFSVEQFLSGPVVFDVDDFCDQHDCLSSLDQLKEHYPNFRCTLFTILGTTSPRLLRAARRRPWIELAAHGVTHTPNEELKRLTHTKLYTALKLMPPFFVRGFRPPGWFLPDHGVRACNDAKCWIACHERDAARLRRKARYGLYVCGQHYDYWHGHTHDVCNNGIVQCLPELLTKWRRDQAFIPVSEAVACYSSPARTDT